MSSIRPASTRPSSALTRASGNSTVRRNRPSAIGPPRRLRRPRNTLESTRAKSTTSADGSTLTSEFTPPRAAIPVAFVPARVNAPQPLMPATT